jgi:hypothetical protein
MADLHLSIADFEIALTNKSEFPIALEEGYASFISNKYSDTPSITVFARNQFPDLLLKDDSPIYSANFEGNTLWNIFKIDNGLRFHVYNSNAPFQLQQVAELDSEMAVWNIYSNPILDKGEQKLFPLLYPMGPLVMYYLTVRFDAIMIHGSGVSDSGKAHIFTGISGQGKTTMAKLWFEAGAEVLNDDRLIVRKNEPGYEVYNTPMFYDDKPRSAKLKSIFAIHHSKTNNIKEVSGAEALAAVSPNLIQHGYSAEIISHHLNFVDEMIKHISVGKLGFVPNQDVVQKIKTNKFEKS